MPTMTISEDGFFNCDGTGKCGGTEYKSIENVKRSFHCESCDRFIKDKTLKVIDERELTKLTDFFK